MVANNELTILYNACISGKSWIQEHKEEDWGVWTDCWFCSWTGMYIFVQPCRGGFMC